MASFIGSHNPVAMAWGSQGNKTVVDTVLPEMLHLVDAHWYQFQPMNPLWHGILGFVMFWLGLISIVGNALVILIFSTTKNLRTPSNLLVVNLAFSDFAMMVVMSPPMIINCYYETWVLGPLFCEIYGMAGSLFGCASIWSMTMIAFDRYNVIVKGLAAKPLTHSGAILRVAFIWAASLAWTLCPLFGWNRYVPEGNMTACGTDYLTKDWFSRSYILIYSVFVYYTPLLLIIACYWFIVKAVIAHEKAMRAQAKKMNVESLRSGEDANKSTECKLAKVALMTISLWFMAWTPYLVINYTGVLSGSLHLSPLFTIWGSVFAKANAVYNPIVYAISHPRYRAALALKFPSLVCGETEAKGGDAQSMVSAQTTLSAEKPDA